MRSKTSQAWMREHVTDLYVKRANAEGFRSRAAFKLQQIAAKDQLLKPGMTVVDLGAAPGGWSQVAAEAVGHDGRVIAVDLLEMPQVPGVTVICGDFHEPQRWPHRTRACRTPGGPCHFRYGAQSERYRERRSGAVASSLLSSRSTLL